MVESIVANRDAIWVCSKMPVTMLKTTQPVAKRHRRKSPSPDSFFDAFCEQDISAHVGQERGTEGANTCKLNNALC